MHHLAGDAHFRGHVLGATSGHESPHNGTGALWKTVEYFSQDDPGFLPLYKKRPVGGHIRDKLMTGKHVLRYRLVEKNGFVLGNPTLPAVKGIQLVSDRPSGVVLERHRPFLLGISAGRLYKGHSCLLDHVIQIDAGDVSIIGGNRGRQAHVFLHQVAGGLALFGKVEFSLIAVKAKVELVAP